MRLGAWNAEGLTSARQTHAMNGVIRHNIDALVLSETWLRLSNSLPPPSPEWTRSDVIHYQANVRARRGKGELSLLFKSSMQFVLHRSCPHSRWAIWCSPAMILAGVYVEPSVNDAQYKMTLDMLTQALYQVHNGCRRPVVVTGDFNCRLGPLVGDHAMNNRADSTTCFAADLHLDLLNVGLRGWHDRFTYVSPSGRSVVDLAMVRTSGQPHLTIVEPPSPTPHQLLVIDLPEAPEIGVPASNRWNWARRAFSDPVMAPKIRLRLAPVFKASASMWQAAGESLDMGIEDISLSEDEVEGKAQEIVDFVWQSMVDLIRMSLNGVACWPPALAKRAFHPQPRADWQAMATMPSSYFLSKVKTSLEALKKAEANTRPSSTRPTTEEFASHYRELFKADETTPQEPPIRCPKPVAAVDATEAACFGTGRVLDAVCRTVWRKAIGPDNPPADIYKCCPSSSSDALSSMF